MKFLSYLRAVHGGGPAIMRREKMIDSTFKFSLIEAVVRIQSSIRRRLARLEFNTLYNARFSADAEGAATSIFLERRQYLERKTEKLMNELSKERMERMLTESASFTQSVWRTKKSLPAAGKMLVNLKEAQIIHAAYIGHEAAISNEAFIVEDFKDIISLPSTVEEEEVEFTQDMRLLLGFSEHVATGRIVVTRNRYTKNSFISRHCSKSQFNEWRNCNEGGFPFVPNGTELLAVNARTLQQISRSQLPVRLRLRRPLKPVEVTHLFQLDPATSDSVQVQVCADICIPTTNLIKK
jgi:hypothetical protein